MNHLVAIDPGLRKCGVVLFDLDQEIVLEGMVIKANLLLSLIRQWKEKYKIKLILLGNGTSSQYWKGLLENLSSIQVIDERNTTILARKRYWELWPPTGFRRLVPLGLLLPPHELDAVAAFLLIEAFLKRKIVWLGPPNFKT